MRIIHAPFLGFFGGIAFSGLGLLPILGPGGSSVPAEHQVVVHKPVIAIAEATERSNDVKSAATKASAEGQPPESSHERRKSVMPVGTANDAVRNSNSSAESTLRHKVELLEQGRNFLNGIDSYTGKLRKQEAVKGELLDEQTIFVKCRHKPFSVYLLWLEGDVGREVIYVDGQNDGKLIAHDGGWKSRIPAIALVPDSALAMINSRHPVTTAGLLNFIETMLEVHKDDFSRSNFSSCDHDDGNFEGRPCHVFTTKYKSATESPECRKSITMIDKEWNVPIHFENFEWSKQATESSEEQLDQATLVEAYSFTDFEFTAKLDDHDFDRKNQEYHFR